MTPGPVELIASALVILMLIYFLRPRKTGMQTALDRESGVKDLVTAAAVLETSAESHLEAADIAGLDRVVAIQQPLGLCLRDLAPLIKALKKVRGEA